MIVINRRPNGEPRTVELSDGELIVKEIHDNLLDAGYSQGEALILIRGSRTPTGLRSSTPTLDAVLADIEFADWLAR